MLLGFGGIGFAENRSTGRKGGLSHGCTALYFLCGALGSRRGPTPPSELPFAGFRLWNCPRPGVGLIYLWTEVVRDHRVPRLRLTKLRGFILPNLREPT